jgi:hypothetical protein
MYWKRTYRIIEFTFPVHPEYTRHKLLLSMSASGVETLQRAPALSRNCIALESGHLKAEAPPTVIDVAIVMHSIARGSEAATFVCPYHSEILQHFVARAPVNWIDV